MKILGLESSCDDTSVALVEASEDGFDILSKKTASQIDIHKKYGGVVPEVAGRAHAEKILPLIEEVLLEGTNSKEQANNKFQKPDVIAVTSGPGLITGLLVGVEAAKALSYLWDVPLLGVNHIEGHIYSTLLEKKDPEFQISNFKFPNVCLIVSGGHTELILMRNHGKYELIGKTRDDAAGEAFDKVAKLLGFDYPGGPKISEYALEGNPRTINFPRPMIKDDNVDFSFAGLKTAALYWLRDHKLSAGKTSENILQSGISGIQPADITIADFCASFEQAIVDVLVTKTIRAAKKYNAKTVILGGGVSANKKLRDTLADAAKSMNYELRTPNLQYAMDNAAMIAAASYHHAKKQEFISWKDIEADPNWKIYSGV
ncbi:MAG: tRNA (adenosine(37)-N6)-threonylcarbamoyltransferase complex transferase subunit TsaD [Candidatus Magasanikbacteria bacterium]